MARSQFPDIRRTEGTSAVKAEEAEIIHMGKDLKDLNSSEEIDDPEGEQLLAETFAHADEFLGKIQNLSAEETELLSQKEQLKKQLEELEAKECTLAAAKKEAEEAKIKADEEARRKEKIQNQRLANIFESISILREQIETIGESLDAITKTVEDYKADL